MALKASLAKTEHAALPADVQKLYVEKDGKFVLEVDGMVSQEDYDGVNTKLTEFRDNNRKLHTENEAFKTKYDGVDPDEHKTLKTKIADLEKKGVTKPDDIAAQVRQAVDAAVAPINAKLEASEKAKAEADGKLTQKQLEDSLWDVGAKAGIRETARRDFIGRAKEVFQWKDGKPVALEGETPLYSKRKGKVTEPLSVDEWVVELLPAAGGDHLFKPSTGAGAHNNGNGPGNGTRLIANDMSVIGNNLEALAKGEMSVQGTN